MREEQREGVTGPGPFARSRDRKVVRQTTDRHGWRFRATVVALTVGALCGGFVTAIGASSWFDGDDATTTSPSESITSKPNATTATVTSAAAATVQTATQRTAITDPFEFCRHVDTIDWPVQSFPGGEIYEGPRQPFDEKFGSTVAWRCWDGSVLGCYTGATAGACMKANESTDPPAELRLWCSQHADQYPPAAATGHSTVYEWYCRGTSPTIVSRRVAREDIDGLGYFLGPWFEVVQ